MKQITTPIDDSSICNLAVGDLVQISGIIYTGRDAVLPKLVSLYENGRLSELNLSLDGAVIFHTAVSPAGVGPTSSNKLDIEGSIPALSRAGVRLHLGKGELSQRTVAALQEFNAVYAVIPPVTALLGSRILKREVVAFAEQGMEAMHMLHAVDFPAVIAVAHGKQLYLTREVADNG